jgi:signal transduction histidine kinase
MTTQGSVPPRSKRSSLNDDAPTLMAALKQSHVDVEAEKGALARTLHDDIGALLVGAIPYTESFPAFDTPMLPDVRLGIFRIFQEALKNVLSQCTKTGLSVRRSARRYPALSSDP